MIVFLIILCIVFVAISIITLICGNLKIAELQEENWGLQKVINLEKKENQKLREIIAKARKISGKVENGKQ